MPFHHHCYLHPDVISLLGFLKDETAEHGGLNAFIDAISRAGEKFYVRTNTLKISPGDLTDRLIKEHPNWDFKQEFAVPEAIGIVVKGPFDMTPKNKEVEVDKYAAESIMISAPLYAPGFKRSITKFRTGEKISMYHKFKLSWVDGERSFLCGNGTALHDSSRMHAIESGAVVQTTESWFISPKIQQWDEFKEGYLLDQNFPSIVASIVLDPRPGELVLDVCAGAGGKTTHIAQLMGDDGKIIAVDRNKKKIQTLQQRCNLLGISCVEPIRSRIGMIQDKIGEINPVKVLVDPPCSALGFHPKIYVDLPAEKLRDLVQNQKRIMRKLLDLLKPGTTIVYSTCTVTVEENEGVISSLIDKYRLKILDARAGLNEKLGSSGAKTPTLSKSESEKMIRFYPHVDGNVGFFIAKLLLE
ncbi:MAG: methyltransferase domain-containing protein [Promethearchaeota archaeon]